VQKLDSSPTNPMLMVWHGSIPLLILPAHLMDVFQQVVMLIKTTLHSYAAYTYDHEGDQDIYVFEMNLGTWGEYSGYPIHEQAWDNYITTAGNDNAIDISAYKTM